MSSWLIFHIQALEVEDMPLSRGGDVLSSMDYALSISSLSNEIAIRPIGSKELRKREVSMKASDA